MGKKDTITKNYMSNREHFADAFNFFIFNGRRVIKTEKLKALDPTEIGLVFQEKENDIVQKVRDVLKQCVVMQDDKVYYLILGIENQTNIHYAMPVRNMLYDVLNYGQQVSEQARQHKKDKDVSGDEYLSGFSKKDKLKPVITLVIYFGTEEWDAPRNLKEMFGDVDEHILRYTADYKVNLIIPKEIREEDFSRFATDFGKVMKYISVADDMEKFAAVTKEEKFKIISLETAHLLNECLGTEIMIPEGGEAVNMCEAWREIKAKSIAEGLAEGRAEGIAKGIAEGRAEGIAEGRAEGKLDTLFSLVKKGILTESQGAREAELSLETFLEKMEKWSEKDSAVE